MIQIFESADLYCYREFVHLLKSWKQEIICSFERPFDDRKQSNALTENVNGRLQELIQVSNGFANFERFRARAIYCLNDRTFFAFTDHLQSNKRQGNPEAITTKRKLFFWITILPTMSILCQMVRMMPMTD